MPSPATLPDLPRFSFDVPGYKRDPYAVYRRLREQTPVTVSARKFVCDAVVVARYDDVQRALKDDECFSNDVRVTPEYRPPPWWVPGILQSFQDNMIGRDGAAHRRLRNLVHKAFTPARVAAMNAGIAALVEKLLDKAEARGGPIDLIGDLALPLPLTVISDMMGVPEADRGKFHRWMAGLLDLEGGGKFTLATALLKMRGLMAFFRRLIALRRRERGDDLVSALVAAEVEGDRLGEQELVDMVFLLLLAGHETTVNLIGNGMLALLEHPDQLARLREEPGLIDTAIEELLRFNSPVQTPSPRYTRTEVEIGGHRIPAGAHVVALIGSANRDPSQFAEPDQPRPRARAQQAPGVRVRPALLRGSAAGPQRGALRPARAAAAVPQAAAGGAGGAGALATIARDPRARGAAAAPALSARGPASLVLAGAIGDDRGGGRMANMQPGWQWCSACSCLVHESREGVCPQTMAHARASRYQVAMSDSEGDGVPGFRWCGRCSQMFWGPEEARSQCPGGGAHTSGESGHYAVPAKLSDRTEYGWFRCGRCQSLFTGNRGVGGTCVDGAAHNAMNDYQFAPRAENVKLVVGRPLPKIKR